MVNSTPRAHLGFLVELTRPVSSDDKDLLAGRYIDLDDESLGDVILEGGSPTSPTYRFLLVVGDDVVAMHVEAALENDHRTASRARRAVLRYPREAEVPPGVVRDGQRWAGGDYIAYSFTSEDQAVLAQQGS